jgi:histidine triad (HIT) family protein
MVKTDCIFCRIAHGEAPADIVCQEDDLIAFRDINPSAPVHILLIPKRHVRSINDLKDEDGALIARMFLMAKKIVKKQGIDQSGYKLIFNVERGGGQLVFHLHLHILGGWGQKGYPRLSDVPI